jgi:two-component system OmpR family response regulator
MPVKHDAPSSPGNLEPLRILVADDDTTTLAFFEAALRNLGCITVCCTSSDAALLEAKRQRFDLLVLDCRMPGGGAISILQGLLHDPGSRSLHTPALATSAEVDAPTRTHLRQLGFFDVLEKPCSVTRLQAVLNRVGRAPALVLDDAAAIASNGDPTITRALRALLREELLQLANELDTIASRPEDFSDRLHRLRSACGFCGAIRLQRDTIGMQRKLYADGVAQGPELASFRRTLEITLAALDRETA